MKMKNQKGFTLIELLVVIAIIGLLSTIAVVAMQGARNKARDAKRISDIKQLSTILDIEAAATPGTGGAGVTLLGCAWATGARPKTSAPACTNNPADATSDIDSNFDDLKDPTAAGAGTACVDASTAACDYSISNAAGTATASTGNYQICFYLESSNQYGAKGMYKITTGGVVSGPVTTTCD